MLFSEFQELVNALPFPVVLYRAGKTAQLTFRSRDTGEEYSGRRYCFLLREGSPGEVRNSLADHLLAIKKDYSDFLRLVILTDGESLALNSEKPPYVYCGCPPLLDEITCSGPLEPYADGHQVYSVNTLTTVCTTSVDTSALIGDICLPAKDTVLRLS